MIHAEAVSVRFEEGVRSIDQDTTQVFNWAAVQLLTGADEVLIWTSGDRNMPTKVDRTNYRKQRQIWVFE